MDSRAVSTVVEKMLAIGLVTLYVSLVATAVYGGVVPDYRTATGAEIGERTLALASERIQQAVPPNATAVDVRLRVNLPATIRDSTYVIRADGRTLVLDHPSPAVSDRVELALPKSVVAIDGRWRSSGQTYVRVYGASGGIVVRLETGGLR